MSNGQSGERAGAGRYAAAVACGLAVSLVGAPAPVSGQGAATAGAVVAVPSVSHLDVESVTAVSSSGSPGAATTGVFRIRVRANHPWRILASAEAAGSREIWVRSGAGDAFRRLEPGAAAVVGSGGRGEAVIDVEYRWVGGSSGLVADAALPLTYTLASAAD